MMKSVLRGLAFFVLASPVTAMSVNLVAAALDAQAAGGYVTTLMPGPVISQATGLPDNIAALFQQDYPGYTYANAAAAATGTLTISTLAAFQNGLQGGLSMVANFTPSDGTGAPHAYQWVQYVAIDPLPTPFAGATSSPFTDPPPDERDDTVPFYWTNLQRDTPGLGYVAGGNINDDPLFSDVPRVNDSRAPVNVSLFLYLADFDSADNAVTVYDGVRYGFDITTTTAVPEPATMALLITGTLVAMVLARCLGFKVQINY
jgi:hypothetical protein